MVSYSDRLFFTIVSSAFPLGCQFHEPEGLSDATRIQSADHETDQEPAGNFMANQMIDGLCGLQGTTQPWMGWW